MKCCAANWQIKRFGGNGKLGSLYVNFGLKPVKPVLMFSLSPCLSGTLLASKPAHLNSLWSEEMILIGINKPWLQLPNGKIFPRVKLIADWALICFNCFYPPSKQSQKENSLNTTQDCKMARLSAFILMPFLPSLPIHSISTENKMMRTRLTIREIWCFSYTPKKNQTSWEARYFDSSKFLTPKLRAFNIIFWLQKTKTNKK